MAFLKINSVLTLNPGTNFSGKDEEKMKGKFYYVKSTMETTEDALSDCGLPVGTINWIEDPTDEKLFDLAYILTEDGHYFRVSKEEEILFSFSASKKAKGKTLNLDGIWVEFEPIITKKEGKYRWAKNVRLLRE